MGITWKDVGSAIMDVAPTLALGLTGPVGLIANGAIAAVKAFTNLGSESKPADVMAELNKLAPDQYIKLREQDEAFKEHMLSAGVDLEKIAADDRNSARDMQKSTDSWVPGALMMVLTVGFFGLLTLLLFVKPPPENMTLLNVMLGSLGTAWVGGTTFYFGSSQGSDKLKNIISNFKGAVA